MTAPSRWQVRQKFVELLERQSTFETSKQRGRFTAKRRGNKVIVTPESTGNERPVNLDEFIDGYFILLSDSAANTASMRGVNASYVLALARLVIDSEQ